MIDYAKAKTFAKTADAKFPSHMQPVERRIVSMLIGAALETGYEISLYDGGAWAVKRSTDAALIGADIASTDEQVLRFRNADGAIGVVSLVFGNDGDDVIQDYSDNAQIKALVVFAETTAGNTIKLSSGWSHAGQTV